MLYHSLDAHPTDPQCFTWTEIFLDGPSLLAHFDNPCAATLYSLRLLAGVTTPLLLSPRMQAGDRRDGPRHGQAL